MPVKPRNVTAAWMFKDPAFPLAVCRVYDHFACPELHGHEFHELVLITKGRGRHLTPHSRHELSAGDVFLIRNNMRHGYDDLDHLDLINIGFKPRQLGLPLGDLGEISGYQHLFGIEPHGHHTSRFCHLIHLTAEQLAKAVQQIVQLEEALGKHPPGFRFTARTQLMELITFLSRCYTNPEDATNEGLLRLGKVVSYLDRQYRHTITIRQLITVAQMSESTLLRTFHQVFECSPIEYLIRLRIQKACEQLPNTDLRIADIARESGFADSNYFTRQFRRVMGCSPRVHRRVLLETAKNPAPALPRAPLHNQPLGPPVFNQTVRTYGTKVPSSKVAGRHLI